MPSERGEFSPHESQYKSVADLPEAVRDQYVDVPEGGFVRKEAVEAYNRWEEEAKEANEGRSVFKKIFLLDRKTAIDIAHETALHEDIGRVEMKTEIKFLEDSIMQAFDSLFKREPEFIKAIKEHKFDTVLSEDASGRIPAEILHRMLNTIYGERGESEVSLVSLPIGQDTGRPGFADAEKIVSQLLEKRSLGEGILYVTDMVHSSSTHRRFISAYEKLTSEAKYKQKRLFGFVSMQYGFPDSLNWSDRELEDYYRRGEITKWTFEREQARRKSFSVLFAQKSGADSNLDTFKKYAGITRTKEGGIEDSALEDYQKQAREALIERVSDKIVKKYEELTTGTKLSQAA